MYARAAGVVRSNHAIYRLLFGHWPASGVAGQLWDWTTLAMASALRSHLRPGASFLDMGTGPTAVLAVYAKHRLRAGRVCGVDHIGELLPSAARTAAGCGMGLELIRSSLFSFVQGRFDLIGFNAPYIPAERGWSLGTWRSEVDERRWCGGINGIETIEGFLAQAPAHLERAGTILLGVNHFYLSSTDVLGAASEAGLQLAAVQRGPAGSSVYLLQATAQRARANSIPPETSIASPSNGA